MKVNRYLLLSLIALAVIGAIGMQSLAAQTGGGGGGGGGGAGACTTILYLHNNSTTCGGYTVKLIAIGAANDNGISSATFNVSFKNGNAIYSKIITMQPGTTVSGRAGGGAPVSIHLNQVFFGLYEYQRFVNVTILVAQPNTTTTSTTTIPTTTIGGGCGSTILYLSNMSLRGINYSNTAMCNGYTVKLVAIGQPNANGMSNATFGVSFGSFTKIITMQSGATVSGRANQAAAPLTIHLNNVFAGLYAYQQWVNVTLTSAPSCGGGGGGSGSG